MNKLEIFSANWVSNFIKESYVQLNNHYVRLKRGFNILYIKDNQLIYDRTYDTCIEDYSLPIQKYLKKQYDKKEYDYLILITHDDASNRINPTLVEKLLIFLDCQEMHHLKFRTAYAMIYDFKNKKIILEKHSEKYAIHEFFEINDKGLTNLGIPFYLICHNTLYFLKKAIKQIEKYTKNIHVIDCRSNYDPLLNYYNDLDKYYWIHKLDSNLDDTWKEIFWSFPEKFIVSDVFFELNPYLPDNFLEIMNEFSNKFGKGKVGCALNISDKENFLKGAYHNTDDVYQWESRFWNHKLEYKGYELYHADINTSFHFCNKNHDINNCMRVGGNFICKWIPWYKGWYKNIDLKEWRYYIKEDLFMPIVKLALDINYDKFKKMIDQYQEIDETISKSCQIKTKVSNNDNLDKKEIILNNLDENIDNLRKIKWNISNELMEMILA